MSFIRKIWKDTVWSKVIATGIIFIIGTIWIAVKSLFTELSFEASFNSVWYYPIPLGWIIVVIILLPIIYLLMSKARIVYTEEHRELDRMIFNRIREIIPADGSIAFIRRNNFAGFSFENRALRELYAYDMISDEEPTFEFIDNELEDIRLDLSNHISAFINAIGDTFPLDGNPTRNTVPQDWEIDQPERFREVVDRIHTAANSICSEYDKLMRLGRRKLGV